MGTSTLLNSKWVGLVGKKAVLAFFPILFVLKTFVLWFNETIYLSLVDQYLTRIVANTFDSVARQIRWFRSWQLN